MNRCHTAFSTLTGTFHDWHFYYFNCCFIRQENKGGFLEVTNSWKTGLLLPRRRYYDVYEQTPYSPSASKQEWNNSFSEKTQDCAREVTRRESFSPFYSHNLTYSKGSGISRTTVWTYSSHIERTEYACSLGKDTGSCQHSSVCRFELCPFSSFSVVTKHSVFVFKNIQQAPAPTLVAFFMNLALSFSISCQERMGVFSSSPTTMPGPCVGGPPVNSIILAPVFGNVP